MKNATFASGVVAMMRASDMQFVSRSRLGTGLVSRGGRIFVVHYDDFSEDESEILTENELASFLAGAENDPWGYHASVVAQAREALARANPKTIVSGQLAVPLSRSRALPFAAALLRVAVEGEGRPAISVSDFPWFIDTTTWMTDAGVVRIVRRRHETDPKLPREHAMEVETASYTLRFHWTAADAFAHYMIEGADEAMRDRVVDAVAKATS